MKKIAFIFTAAMALSASLPAVEQLPPLFQDLKELRAILTNDNLGKLLPAGDTIMEIRRVENGYIIKTNKHQVLAKVSYQSGGIGPIPFVIEFENPQPINGRSQ